MGVHRQFAAEADTPALDERPALALRAEAQVFDLRDHHASEAVVNLGDVDILVLHAGHIKGARRGLCQAQLQHIGPLGNRAGRVRVALRHADDADRRARVLGVVPAAHHHRGRPVAFQAAVEQAVGVGDHAGRVVVLHRQRLFHDGVVVQHRVLAHGDGDFRELVLVGAVKLHVPADHRRVTLGRRERADRILELRDLAKLQHGREPRRHPAVGIAAPAEHDQYVLAHARRDDRRRTLQRGHRARAAHGRLGREADIGQAEAGHHLFGHGPQRIGDDAVDLVRLQARIADGLDRGFQHQTDGTLVGAAGIGGLADAGDGGLAVQAVGHGQGYSRWDVDDWRGL